MSNYYNYVNCCNRSYLEPYLFRKVTPQSTNERRNTCNNEINNLQKSCRNHITTLNNEIVKLKADLKKLSNTFIKNQNLNNTTQKNLQLNTQPIPEIQQKLEPSWNVFAKNNLNNSYDYQFSDSDEENGSIPIWYNRIDNQQYNNQQYNDQQY